jgi:hypothetical protein
MYILCILLIVYNWGPKNTRTHAETREYKHPEATRETMRIHTNTCEIRTPLAPFVPAHGPQEIFGLVGPMRHAYTRHLMRLPPD